MFGGHFYHEKTRRAVAIFGKLFNNIYVIRKNQTTGASTSQVKVPLAYAPKVKYLDRIRENPSLRDNTKVAIKLPRMSFEITSLSYDNARQIAKTNTFQKFGNTANDRAKFFTGVPYILTFQLNIYCKTQDDALQIVEQILPTFNPQYSITLKPFTDYPDILEDIPITIGGVSFQDDFESELASRRTIIYTMDFEMRVRFYSGLSNSKIVRDVRAKVFDVGSVLADSDLRIKTIQIEPNPTTLNILGDSDFGFLRTDYDADSDAP